MRTNSSLQINITRIIFLLIAIFCGMAVSSSIEVPTSKSVPMAVILAMAVIYIEHLSRQFTLRSFSHATFGLMIGIFCAWLLNKVPLAELIAIYSDDLVKSEAALLIFGLGSYLVLGFLGVTLSLRSGQEDFAFIVPYVRFRQSNVSELPVILDQSVILDGRLVELIETKVIEGHLLVPNYVLNEINLLASDPVASRKANGKRGLEVLETLRKDPEVKLTVYISQESNDSGDFESRLINTTRVNNAKLITTNSSLTKNARLQNVPVMNLDEVSLAFQQTVAVGDKISLAISRTGKEEHQGVGYLSDGSMIVVNQAVSLIGTTQNIVIISKLHSKSGQLVFAELDL